MVLTALKERVVAAKTGHSLLKRKSDAIKANLNNILRDILDTKRRLFKITMRDAAFSHTEATYYAGPFNSQVIDTTKLASFRLKTTIKNVAGVRLPVFRKYDEDQSGETIIGLSSGGRYVVKCKEMFTKALLDLVTLATLQTHLKTLDEALKVTNRRVNALEFVILPLLDNTMKYVDSELGEQEREDNYRIKKVKDIRTRDQEREDDEKRIEFMRRRAKGLVDEKAEYTAPKGAEAPSVLGQSEDTTGASTVVDLLGRGDGDTAAPDM